MSEVGDDDDDAIVALDAVAESGTVSELVAAVARWLDDDSP